VKEKPSIDYLIRSTWLSISKMYNEQASKYDSTMVIGFTLLSIDPKKGTPSTSLGPKMGIEPTSLSRTLKMLEERELIYKTSNSEDKRSVIINLTESGLKMRDLSRSVVFSFYNAVENKVPKEKLDIFYEVLDIIYNLTSNNKIFFQKETQYSKIL